MTDEHFDFHKQHQRYTDRYGPPVGDCFRTAVACLMGIPRDMVPHFAEEHQDDGLGWWEAAVAYVEEVYPDWTLVCVAPIFPVYEGPTGHPPTVILSGKSPRGDWNHSVLVDSMTGELVWDPYPGGNGVETQGDVMALTPNLKRFTRYFGPNGEEIYSVNTT